MAVAFDGINKTITITLVSDIDVRRDIYSAWKRWAILSSNTKHLQAMRPVGGDDIGGGSAAPAFFFLMNDWKVVVDGVVVDFKYNLYSEAASNANTNPFVYANGGASTNNISTSPTVETGVSGLTASESNQLSNIESNMTIEGSISHAESMRLQNAVLLGKVSGAGTGTEVFRDINDTKDRVTATVDNNGNRTAIILDET